MREIIGNTTATPNPQPDWLQNDVTKADFIKNKPTLGALASKDEVTKEELATDIQEALDKANSALQSYTETDPTVPAWAKADTKPSYSPDEVGAIPANQKGAANGVAELDENGIILSSQLPSYVDDVEEYESKTSFPTSGEAGKIYIDISTNITYRWSGTVYTPIGSDLALGETSSSAYRGDRGKVAYDHSQITEGNPHGVTAEILGLADVATSGSYGDLTGTPTNVSQFINDAGYLTEADAPGSATAVQDNLNTHLDDKNNPHGVSLTQLGVTATADELNYVDGVTSNIQTQLNGKLSDYIIEIYNGTSGNPKPVRFLTVNYTTCDSENGVAIKVGMVSGHGNGTSYAFLQDAIIKVGYQGGVEVNNFKYYGSSTGTYDGASRQYGDIFWVIDTTNKIVDFYVLMGQYARVNSTVYKKLTYSSGGTVTQHKSGTAYSSGDKVWANNSNIALLSDIPTFAEATATTTGLMSATDKANLDMLVASAVTVLSGTTEPTADVGKDGDIYLVLEG